MVMVIDVAREFDGARRQVSPDLCAQNLCPKNNQDFKKYVYAGEKLITKHFLNRCVLSIFVGTFWRDLDPCSCLCISVRIQPERKRRSAPPTWYKHPKLYPHLHENSSQTIQNKYDMWALAFIPILRQYENNQQTSNVILRYPSNANCYASLKT
eukprot:143058-Amphidinium_carterae.1